MEKDTGCPLSTLSADDLRRAKALEQAVIYANGMAHAVRKEPSAVVDAARLFLEFLTPPKDE